LWIMFSWDRSEDVPAHFFLLIFLLGWFFTAIPSSRSTVLWVQCHSNSSRLYATPCGKLAA
jgi:hypothetical protein